MSFLTTETLDDEDRQRRFAKFAQTPIPPAGGRRRRRRSRRSSDTISCFSKLGPAWWRWAEVLSSFHAIRRGDERGIRPAVIRMAYEDGDWSLREDGEWSAAGHGIRIGIAFEEERPVLTTVVHLRETD